MTELMFDIMAMRVLNCNPMELRRIPFHELELYKIAIATIAKEKPELLMMR